jgi:hypothetical protein
MFLRANQDGAGHAIQYSLISLLFGWWGIPWGPIWTISTIVTNAGGGKDVTHAVLADKYGEAIAGSVLAQRGAKKAPASTLMKLFRVGLVAVPLLIAASIMLTVSMGGREHARSVSSDPGVAMFEAANSQIDSHQGTVAFGNNLKAIAAAQTFSSTMKTIRDVAFSGGKPGGLSASKHEFLTYCELRDDECIFLVHVPELRRYKSDAKDSMGEVAWRLAQMSLLKSGAGHPDMKLHVGLRGIALYDRVLSGVYVPNATKDNNGLRSTERGGRPEKILQAVFAKPTTPAINAEASTNLPVIKTSF